MAARKILLFEVNKSGSLWGKRLEKTRGSPSLFRPGVGGSERQMGGWDRDSMDVCEVVLVRAVIGRVFGARWANADGGMST